MPVAGMGACEAWPACPAARAPRDRPDSVARPNIPFMCSRRFMGSDYTGSAGLRRVKNELLRAEEQDRNLDQVADAIRGGAEQHIRNKAVAVRGHGDEIDALICRCLDELRRRIAPREP